MLNVNRSILIKTRPHAKISVDIVLLQLCENEFRQTIRFKSIREKNDFKLSHLDYRETKAPAGFRRFFVSKAYGTRDK